MSTPAGQRLKLPFCEVPRSNKGPQVRMSLAPEPAAAAGRAGGAGDFRGAVELRAIAASRIRSKVAVSSLRRGSTRRRCVGLRASDPEHRRRSGGERIDVVQWDPTSSRFVANALGPAPGSQVSMKRPRTPPRSRARPAASCHREGGQDAAWRRSSGIRASYQKRVARRAGRAGRGAAAAPAKEKAATCREAPPRPRQRNEAPPNRGAGRGGTTAHPRGRGHAAIARRRTRHQKTARGTVEAGPGSRTRRASIRFAEELLKPTEARAAGRQARDRRRRVLQEAEEARLTNPQKRRRRRRGGLSRRGRPGRIHSLIKQPALPSQGV